MNLQFPTALKRGQKGILDGLSIKYLKEQLGLSVAPPPFDSATKTFTNRKLPWIAKIWWWQGAEDEPAARMKCPDALCWVYQLPDAGRELAFIYECLARALGEYPLGCPFNQLTVPQLIEIFDLFENPTSKHNTPALLEWPLPPKPESTIHLSYQYDPSIVSPKKLVKLGELWSEPRAITFNLLKSNATIEAELRNLLDALRKKANCPEPKTRSSTRTHSLKGLEFWDLFRWKNDSPTIFTPLAYKAMIQGRAIKERPTQISQLRALCRGKFPEFKESPQQTPIPC